MTLPIVSAFGARDDPAALAALRGRSSAASPASTSNSSPTSARGYVGGGGAAHALVGTLVITGVAALDLGPDRDHGGDLPERVRRPGRLRSALTFFVDVMTGIPSIVAGLFAYALFEIFFGPGIRMGVMGSVALSVLMIPIVIRTSEEVLKIVPNHLREAAYALGTPKWRTIAKVVLPTAFAGLSRA